MEIQFPVKNMPKKKCKSSFLPNEASFLRVQKCSMQCFKTSSLVDSRWNCIFEQPPPRSARTITYLFLRLSQCSQLAYTVSNFFTVPVIFLNFVSLPRILPFSIIAFKCFFLSAKLSCLLLRHITFNLIKSSSAAKPCFRRMDSSACKTVVSSS